MEPAFLAFYQGFDDDAYWRLPHGRWKRLVEHMQATRQAEQTQIERLRHG